MPLHMVFRASSLIASLVIGFAAFGRKYGLFKVIGVVIVTVGVVTITLADASKHAVKECCEGSTSGESESSSSTDSPSDMTTWLTGVTMLVVALFLSATLGHCQEWSYRTFGAGIPKARLAAEGKFYSHMIALPLFLSACKDIVKHAQIFNASPPIEDVLGSSFPALSSIAGSSKIVEFVMGVPVLWIYLAANVLTQYVCISGVYSLTAISSTLTCTLTLTVRKFLSLIVSVLYFGNDFSAQHWSGTALVFAGVGVYSFSGMTAQSSKGKAKRD